MPRQHPCYAGLRQSLLKCLFSQLAVLMHTCITRWWSPQGTIMAEPGTIGDLRPETEGEWWTGMGESAR